MDPFDACPMAITVANISNVTKPNDFEIDLCSSIPEIILVAN
jgi:hypothetical protein